MPAVLRRDRIFWATAAALLIGTLNSSAQSEIIGSVRDETGGVLPGVVVQLKDASSTPHQTATDQQGGYRFVNAAPGPARLSFAFVNFAITRREVTIPSDGTLRVDTTLHLALGADVTVTAKSSFTNLADAENPAQNRVGSVATSLANLEVGYKLTPSIRLALDVFNLFDAKDSDIDYLYPSRLQGEPP
jgi:Carboxypeptidase regulatory-like domain